MSRPPAPGAADSNANPFNQRVIEEFRARAGRVGGDFEGVPLILLTTTGRRSGLPRTTPATYLRDGGDWVVFAANGGDGTDPAWCRNLRAHPVATVEHEGRTFPVEAVFTEAAERDRLYAAQVAISPQFADFEKRTDRVIPVVRLRPAGAARDPLPAYRVDHHAFTVTDLDRAVAFFTDALGAQLLYEEGPVARATGDWMRRKLGVHPRAVARIAMLRLGPVTRIELFAYTDPGQKAAPPPSGTAGHHRLALRVSDPDAAARHLAAVPGVTAGGTPGDFVTPWGLTLRLLRLPPDGPAEPHVDHVAHTVADVDAAVAFFTDVLGAEETHRTPEGDAALRFGPAGRIVLSPGAPAAPPRNSDIGGRHLAFDVDDVDAAAAHLATVPGVRLLGTPETIEEGPLTGDRWLYFTTPTGIPMEIRH
ncbi:nitroreductase/quinone reductase family protein [Streptomyces aureoversilis]|uniref:Nitroreductase/quinone reductase family protein n=1 Tax=Streptomyces aureoversilis TaxID=67277 RepID=A0ABV9ZY92_9ACTN